MFDAEQPETDADGPGDTGVIDKGMDPDDDDDGEEETEAGAAPDLAERADMLWFKLLDDFTDRKFPALGSVCEADQDDPYQRISPIVKQAQDLAIVAAFRAMERLIETVAPEMPLLDFSRIGRDQ